MILKYVTTHKSTVWLGSSVRPSECSHGMREVLGSSPGQVMCFFSPVTFGGSVLRLQAAKGLSRRFQHGTEQIPGRI